MLSISYKQLNRHFFVVSYSRLGACLIVLFLSGTALCELSSHHLCTFSGFFFMCVVTLAMVFVLDNGFAIAQPHHKARMFSPTVVQDSLRLHI